MYYLVCLHSSLCAVTRAGSLRGSLAELRRVRKFIDRAFHLQRVARYRKLQVCSGNFVRRKTMARLRGVFTSGSHDLGASINFNIFFESTSRIPHGCDGVVFHCSGQTRPGRSVHRCGDGLPSVGSGERADNIGSARLITAVAMRSVCPLIYDTHFPRGNERSPRTCS